jgi:hypothetical protein
MYVPFNSIPDHSRLWIYQSNRKFTSDEVSIISDALLAFTKQWSAHGEPLLTSFDIRLEQFIILAADEKYVPPSGCSIDGAVRTIKDLGNRFAIDFFDRTATAFLRNEGVTLIPMTALKSHFNNGILNHESLVVNLLVSTKADLADAFVVPVSNTWLKRYLPAEKMTG